MKSSTYMFLGMVIAALSAPADYAFKLEQNISYRTEAELAEAGDYARARCLLDVRWPVGVTNFATIINFHGGGLVAGNRGWPRLPDEARNKDPIAQVAAGYRLLTNATPEQCIGDAAAAVAWTLKNISRFGGDPKKVFVTGISGGGYLTAMIGMDPKWLAAYGVKRSDLAGIAPYTGQMTKHFNIRKVGFKDTEPQFQPKIDEWAPLFYAKEPGIPPACFVTGSRDLEWKGRVEENEMLARAMRDCGYPKTEFHETEGSHGGGVEPSSYFFRDFVLKTVDADGVGRFADGERVAFLGDSITQGGGYIAYLQLYQDLRHPGSGTRLMNCGISGDSAKGGFERLSWDAFALKPDRLFVMFGMNDVNRPSYKSLEPTKAEKETRDLSMARYDENSRKIVEALRQSGKKTVLMTPTPYDQYNEFEVERLLAVNEAGLATAADHVRALAREHHLGLVDLHAPLTKTLKNHPGFRFLKDRVHPGKEGHLLIAAQILDAMCVSPLVAKVVIDAKNPAAPVFLPRTGASNSKNVQVTNLSSVPPGGVAFNYAPKALPFPALPEYVKDEAVYPLTARFNQELMIIQNLPAGRYALSFDGRKLGEYTAEELAKGVNVAILDTPNQRLAQAAGAIAAQLQFQQSEARVLAAIERQVRTLGADPADFAAADQKLDGWLAKMEAEKSIYFKYWSERVVSYRKHRTGRAKLCDAENELRAKLAAFRPAIARVRVEMISK